MVIQNCDLLLRQLHLRLLEDTKVRPLGNAGCTVQIPFFDNAGDPITITVHQENGHYVIDDGGAIAGHLFATGQHTENTPAYKLLWELHKAYDLEIDRNEGVVKSIAQEHDLIDVVMNVAKVVVTIITTTPHIRIYPQRIRRFGPRLRARIKEDYSKREILSLVEQNYELSGLTVERWPIDFHWQVMENQRAQDVFIVAVDLDIAEPLRKAEHLSALALDVKGQRSDSSLRVVIDRRGKDADARVAASFLQEHRKSLGFLLFDFGLDKERNEFLERSAGEILGQQGQEWRNLWTRRLPFEQESSTR